MTPFWCLLSQIFTVALCHKNEYFPQRGVVNVNEININGQTSRVSLLSDSYAINVMDYGAKSNDSSFDNTSPFQKALDAASAMGGSIVYVPAGHFYFKGQINVPSGVSLIGTYLTVPLHNRPADINDITDGSVLAPSYGKGKKSNDSSDAFITMQQQSSLQGLVIFYPDQVCADSMPFTFPPTIYIGTSDVTVSDIELVCFESLHHQHIEQYIIKSI